MKLLSYDEWLDYHNIKHISTERIEDCTDCHGAGETPQVGGNTRICQFYIGDGTIIIKTSPTFDEYQKQLEQDKLKLMSYQQRSF